MTTAIDERKISHHLPPSERETIIVFNESKEPAHIFTYNKTWQRHLEKRLNLLAKWDNGYGGREYDIDKKRIRPPRAPIKLSAKAKKERGKRLTRTRLFSAKTP